MLDPDEMTVIRDLADWCVKAADGRCCVACDANWLRRADVLRKMSGQPAGTRVVLYASDAQMREIHTNWNLIASKCTNDDKLWPCVSAIADILFRQIP